jgi:hypothetical protein
MMTDNELDQLPNPVDTTPTSDMAAFPDDTSDWNNGGKTTDINGNSFGAGDRAGYILFQHDMTGDTDNSTLVNYVATQTTKGTYTVDAYGTVTQESTGYE